MLYLKGKYNHLVMVIGVEYNSYRKWICSRIIRVNRSDFFRRKLNSTFGIVSISELHEFLQMHRFVAIKCFASIVTVHDEFSYCRNTVSETRWEDCEDIRSSDKILEAIYLLLAKRNNLR